MRLWRRRDRLIDTLIVPPVVKYTGTDEALAARTRVRREQAEQVRLSSLRIDTKDEQKIHTRVDSLRLFGGRDLPRRATGDRWST